MIDDLVAGLSDPDPEKRRKAVFGVLSHRRHDLLSMLYELALREKDGGLAVLATQVALTLRANPPDPQQENIIEKALAEKDGHNRLGPSAWDYLAASGTRRHRLRLLAALGTVAKPPRQVWSFLSSCLGHCDPDVRMAACKPAVAAGYGRLVAWVLAMIEDPDAGVGREAFAAVETAPRPLLVEALDEAIDDSEEWVASAVAPFLPVFAQEDMREMLRRGRENPLPRVAAKCREALGRLDARKAAARHLPPPPPIPQVVTGPVLQLHVPAVASSPSPSRTGSAPPPGPLPWAHLVTTPPPPPPSGMMPAPTTLPAGAPIRPPAAPAMVPTPAAASTPMRHELVPPVAEPAAPRVPAPPVIPPELPKSDVPPLPATIPSPPPAQQTPSENVGPSPVVSQAGRGVVKKERVISMRGKISSETGQSKPASPPTLSPEEQAAMFFGGAKPAPTVAIGGLAEERPASPIPEMPPEPQPKPSFEPPAPPETQPRPGADSISKDIMQESDEAALAMLEAVPIDLVAALEEAPAVSARPLQLEPAPSELPPPASVETKPEPAGPRLAVDLPGEIPASPSLAASSGQPLDPPAAVTPPPARAEEPPIPAAPAPVAGAIELPRSQMITSILERYPSFVTEPLARLFEPATAAPLMKALQAMLEPLIAFLSFTFMQTYLFFTPRNPKGDQVVKDALKAHLSGPNAVRFLHHLSLLIKGASGDGFFTIALAKAMSESSADTNPLFVLREMSEFLQTPPDEAADGLNQVAEVLPPLLTSFKGILHNPIVLRLPPGAREPFLNLSGPKSAPLAAADRPGLDLPPNELILLSKDRSEALGLFPYFTFDGQRVVFRTPADEDFKTLLERLELTL